MYTRNMYTCILLLLLFTTSQMKSLHYDQCFVYIYLTYIFVVSSRRNKTNPHQGNKYIPVLDATHLQAFKPKLSTYDQLLKTDQQDVSFSMFVCICWNIFNRIHFFAICDVFFFIYAIHSCFMWYFYIWRAWKVDEAASTNFFSHHIQCISHC